MFNKEKIIISLFALTLFSCSGGKKDNRLAILGPKQIDTTRVNGQVTTDTVYHKIADFGFLDQDSVMVTNKSLDGKIYIADFFFTTCPTICPKMNAQLVRVYDKYKDDGNIKILSYSIDPVHDSVAVLRNFARRLDVSSKTWHFVTGDQDKIFELVQNSYMVTAMEDQSTPGGFLHSGALILVDPERRVRGYYNGTSPEEGDRLIDDIPKLLAEYGLP